MMSTRAMNATLSVVASMRHLRVLPTCTRPSLFGGD